MKSIREKLTINSPSSYEEWRRNTKRGFWLLLAGIISSWVAAGLFTVWLLRG